MPLLEVEGLCVDFRTARGPVRVLDEVGFHLEAGEVLGIVGESGCGKSMTSLSLLQLVPAPGRISGGAIRYGGQDLLALGPARMRDVRGRDIAMIFQEPMTALNPVFTVGQQIVETIVRHRGMGPRAARAGRDVPAPPPRRPPPPAPADGRRCRPSATRTTAHAWRSRRSRRVCAR